GEKARAEKAREAARKKEAAAKAALDKLVKSAGEVTAELKAVGKQQATLEKKLTGAPAPDVLEKQIADIRAANAKHKDLQLALQKASAAEREAIAKVESVDSKLAEARRQGEKQREPLIADGLDVPAIGTDLVATWTEVASWAAAAVPTHKKRAND